MTMTINTPTRITKSMLITIDQIITNIPAKCDYTNVINSLAYAHCIIISMIAPLISCNLSFPIVGLKMSSLPTLALKSPNKIFMWYLGNLLNICSSSS
jgi:hypothetical protein